MTVNEAYATEWSADHATGHATTYRWTSRGWKKTVTRTIPVTAGPRAERLYAGFTGIRIS